jgi:hypothetical protein
LLCFLILLAAVPAAFGNPTALIPDTQLYKNPLPAGVEYSAESEIKPARVHGDTFLMVGVGLLRPAVHCGVTVLATNDVPIRDLGPAPAAFLTVVISFCLITLIRDRRFWLTVLTALACAGQGGIHSVPKFASHLWHGNPVACSSDSKMSPVVLPNCTFEYVTAWRPLSTGMLCCGSRSTSSSSRLALFYAGKSSVQKHGNGLSPVAIFSCCCEHILSLSNLPWHDTYINLPTSRYSIVNAGRAPPRTSQV